MFCFGHLQGMAEGLWNQAVPQRECGMVCHCSSRLSTGDGTRFDSQ